MPPISILDNEEGPFHAKFEQAYIDIPFAKRDCDYAKSFFQREYNVRDEDIIELHDASSNEVKATFFLKLHKMLAADRS